MFIDVTIGGQLQEYSFPGTGLKAMSVLAGGTIPGAATVDLTLNGQLVADFSLDLADASDYRFQQGDIDLTYYLTFRTSHGWVEWGFYTGTCQGTTVDTIIAEW